MNDELRDFIKEHRYDRVDEMVNALSKLIASNQPTLDPYDFVKPCKPDCTPKEHAYHQGQWDMAVRIEKAMTSPNTNKGTV